MKIALAQMKNEGSTSKNLEKSIRLIREAAGKKADMILFPEVQLTEFFPQYVLTGTIQKVSELKA